MFLYCEWYLVSLSLERNKQEETALCNSQGPQPDTMKSFLVKGQYKLQWVNGGVMGTLLLSKFVETTQILICLEFFRCKSAW